MQDQDEQPIENHDEEFGDQKAAEDFAAFLSLYDKVDEYRRYARERFEFLKEQFLTDP